MDDVEISKLIEEARSGSDDALGELLETVRTYLLLVANQETDVAMRSKVAASDVVQDAFCLVKQHFQSFRGSTQTELRAWMRKIPWTKFARF